jgi:hypothetical protein
MALFKFLADKATVYLRCNYDQNIKIVQRGLLILLPKPPKNLEYGQRLTTGRTYLASLATLKRWIFEFCKMHCNYYPFFAVQRRSTRLLFCWNETYQFAPGVSL